VWGENVTQVGLYFLSSRRRFAELNTWQRLEREGSLEAISNAIRSGYSSYSVSELGIPGLRHFFYKSRPHVQVTGPEFEEPYEDLQERRRYACRYPIRFWTDVDASHRLITLYQLIQDAVHAKSGQEKTLKLQYLRTEKEGILGWVRLSLLLCDGLTHSPPPIQITQPFELYVTLSPILPKSAVIGAANAVVKWVKKEESKLFLRDAPVF
jgi:hypothetical protein